MGEIIILIIGYLTTSQPAVAPTRDLAGDAAKIQQASDMLPTIPGEVPDLVQLPSGCIFADRCGHAVAQCREREPEFRHLTQEHSVRCPYADQSAN